MNDINARAAEVDVTEMLKYGDHHTPRNPEKSTSSFTAMNDFQFNYLEQARSLEVKNNQI